MEKIHQSLLHLIRIINPIASGIFNSRNCQPTSLFRNSRMKESHVPVESVIGGVEWEVEAACETKASLNERGGGSDAIRTPPMRVPMVRKEVI